MSRRFLFLLSAFASLFVAVGCSRAPSAPRKLPAFKMQAGKVVDQLGTYACGSSGLQLHIASAPAESTSIDLVDGEPEQWSYRTGAFVNEEWFVAMDQYERIWIFVGSSAGGRQVPSVFRDGLAFNKAGQIKDGGSQVSITGDWDGVPEEFLARVLKAAPQSLPHPVPAVAPVYAPDRHSRLVAELDKQRAKR